MKLFLGMLWFTAVTLGAIFSVHSAWSQTSAVAEAAKPQAESAATQLVDLSIELETATGKLYGSLLLPSAGATNAAVPVVVIHAGSGPTDRDGNSGLSQGKSDSLKMLAAGLALNGIASVRYDKRGVAKSAAAGPAEKDLRFDNYVDDLAAWVSKLKADKRFSRVTVIGHSEGSLIGMIAAEKAKADGYVSIAGIARGASDVLRTQLKSKLPDALAKESERTLKSLEAGKTVEDAPEALAALYRPSVQPYLISWFSKRPAVEIAKLNVPVLIVQGTTDIQVAVTEAEALKTAAPKAELSMLAGMNHVLKKMSGNAAEQAVAYNDPTLPLQAELVPRIAKFVLAIK
jgi:uncharacterized protein